jgi:hypothetical protein
MKRLMTTMIVALSLVTCAYADQFKERAKEIQKFYNQGLIAMKTGKMDTAKASFRQVLKLQPGHGPAKYQLSRLDIVGKNFKLQQRKAKFKTTKLKEIDFHGATLQEVVEALNVMSKEATDKKWSPNLIIQDPKGKMKGKEINLKMSNIPVAAVLQYVMDMTGGIIQYDEHATVIRAK